MKIKALSIVAPNGQKIALNQKTIEVRSWMPPKGFSEDLLIVENKKYLKTDGDIDLEGNAVAIVKIKNVRTYVPEDIPAACATRWEPGYYSWELNEVRPFSYQSALIAQRGIYEVDIELD